MTAPLTQALEKQTQLLTNLRTLPNAVLAFSGGVDSTFLLAALQASGIPFLAVTGVSPTMPLHDRKDAETLVRTLKIANHRFIDSDEIRDQNFLSNSPQRCFFCKNNLFGQLTRLASAEGFVAVLDGSTLDDLQDYRPGLQAKENHQVLSPILEAGMTKKEVRLLSREMGLKTWDKPASPCLSSRIPYGDAIEVPALRMVDSAEDLLRNLGFRELRVRKDRDTARIEIPEADIPRLLDAALRRKITTSLLEIGFKYITLDLEGFSSGKLNRVIPIVPSIPASGGTLVAAPSHVAG